MSVQANDIWRTIGFLEEDARGLLAKLRDLRMMLASVELPKEKSGPVCDLCGVERPNEQALVDHKANVHGLIESETV